MTKPMTDKPDDVLRRWLTEGELAEAIRLTFRSDVHSRVAYDTLVRLAALLSEREPEWVKCSDQLPERDARVWWANADSRLVVEGYGSACHSDWTHWLPYTTPPSPPAPAQTEGER